VEPLESEAWVRDKMLPYFPLDVFKNEERDPWFNPESPSFDADRVVEVMKATNEQPPRHADGFPSHIHQSDVALKFAGAGGDGAQTAAMLTTKSSINEGFDATHIPSYGPESRGGTSYADVHLSSEEVLSPAAPEPHVLVAFNAPSLQKFGPLVRENGTIVYDSSRITDAPKVAKGVTLVPVPCTEIARSLGNALVKNVVALGAMQQATQLLPMDSFLTTLRMSLRDNCAMSDLNEEAFKWGVKAAKEGITKFE
jgi:Pyruvate/2-oxoacid:ferredoxin oxidoreductase gamma subunit